MALSITIANDTAISIRLIRTPWPIVRFEFLLSLIKILIELWPWNSIPKDYKSPPPSPGKKKLSWIFWAINFVRLIGALVFLIQGLIAKEFIERGSSVVILCCGMLIFCVTVSKKSSGFMVLNYFAAALCFLCYVLFLINGGIAGFKAPSSVMITTKYIGCASTDYLPSWYENGCMSKPSLQIDAPLLMGDLDRLVSWIWGAGIGAALLVSLWIVGCCSAARRDRFGKWKRRLQICLPVAIILGGSFCLAAAVIDAQNNTVDYLFCDESTTMWAADVGVWYYPCYLDSLAFNGSSTGFIREWTEPKIDVVRGLFTW